MTGKLLCVIGTWIFCDGLASLYTYTAKERSGTQTWLRDHSLRVLRCVLGIVTVIIGMEV